MKRDNLLKWDKRPKRETYEKRQPPEMGQTLEKRNL